MSTSYTSSNEDVNVEIDRDDAVSTDSSLSSSLNATTAATSTTEHADKHRLEVDCSSGSYDMASKYDDCDDSSVNKCDSSVTSTEIDQTADQMCNDKCNLIINYLPCEVNDTDLYNLFIDFGDILCVKVVKDSITRRSLGYGFVKFTCEIDACNAIAHRNGYQLGYKTIKVSVARPSSDDIKNCKLYITNLPRDITEAEIIDNFKCYGNIVECRLLSSNQGQQPIDRYIKYTCKGVAFLQFSNKTESNSALTMHGKLLSGCVKPLSIKYAAEVKHRAANGGSTIDTVPQPHTNIKYDNNHYINSSTNHGNYRAHSKSSNNGNNNNRGSRSTHGINNHHMVEHGCYPQLSSTVVSPTIAYPIMHAAVPPTLPIVPYQYMYVNGNYPDSITTYEEMYQQQLQVYELIISNLPDFVGMQYVHNLVSAFGRILCMEVSSVYDKTNPPKHGKKGDAVYGRAKVRILGLLSAQYAYRGLNGLRLGDGYRPLRVHVTACGISDVGSSYSIAYSPMPIPSSSDVVVLSPEETHM